MQLQPGIKPPELAPLFTQVRALAGAGPRTEAAIAKLLRTPPDQPPRLIELLWHFPNGYIDRRFRSNLAGLEPGRIATIEVVVKKHKAAPPSTRAPYRVTCEDETGEIDLVFFHAERRFIERLLPVGEARIVSGAVERFNNRLQMPHPDHILTRAQAEALPDLEPVYPASAGVSQKVLRRLISQALERLPALPEWIDGRLRTAERWPDFAAALVQIHHPLDDKDMAAAAGMARKRLAFDELFASQLGLAVLRRQFRRSGGRAIIGDNRLVAKLRAVLPFRLTRSQEIALAEIGADMAAPRRMLRLLQGDVGSGKTAVALLSMARTAEAGCQAALMAPTEVLARQHFQTIAPLAAAAGLNAALLTGREQGRSRQKILESLERGETHFLIGTHALFQTDVQFKDLALAVIDEQHRFGVHQRVALQAKAGEAGCDVLVMTATPIPRTLILTLYGDMDVSRLTEKPAGRKPILTRAVPIERLNEVVRAIARALKRGAQVYWVCPLVESSPKTEAAAAEERAAYLRQYFGESVVLIHGRMKSAEKDAAIRSFAARERSILVATTVIEVGVDVPNASIMVIEHAERFGLAQLHQLRGRVGRATRNRPAFCSMKGRYRKQLAPGSTSCARPMTVSGFLRKICDCAAGARCSARGSRAIQASASHNFRKTRRFCAWPPTKRAISSPEIRI